MLIEQGTFSVWATGEELPMMTIDFGDGRRLPLIPKTNGDGEVFCSIPDTHLTTRSMLLPKVKAAREAAPWLPPIYLSKSPLGWLDYTDELFKEWW